VESDADGDGCGGEQDCNDDDDAVHPAAIETCDGIDDDSDGVVDEEDATGAPTWYADVDGDGFGDSEAAVVACNQPSGAVAGDSDCDDSDASTNPEADEVCDGIDNDCDDTDGSTYPGAPEACGDGVVNACDGTEIGAGALCLGDLDLGKAAARLDGEGPGDGAGGSVAAAGDVNGDGYADILVGASQYTPDLVRAAGATCLVTASQLLGGY